MRSPRVAVKDCRWRTASWMVFSFQFEVFCFQSWVRSTPLLTARFLGSDFLFYRLSLPVCVGFFFIFVAIRFDSSRWWILAWAWLALQWFEFEFGFPTPARTQLSRSTDRLQLIAGSQLVLPTYQPTNFPIWLRKSRSSARSVNLHLAAFCVFLWLWLWRCSSARLSWLDSSINLTSWAGLGKYLAH